MQSRQAMPHFRPGVAAFSAGRRRIRRAFDTVSTRMILIILLSSLPLAVLSGVVSWHNYEIADSASTARAETLLMLLRGRTQQSLARATQALHALDSLGEMRDPQACARMLQLALLLQHPRYRSLAMLDQQGHVLCSAGPAPPMMPSAVGRPDGIEDVLVRRSSDGAPELAVNLLQKSSSDPSRVLFAELVLGWRQDALFGGDAAALQNNNQSIRIWLLGPHGLALPVCPRCGDQPPPELSRVIEQARASPKVGNNVHLAIADPARSAVLGRLAGPIDALVLTDPSTPEARALRVFILRVIGIVLLFGLGLLGVSIGANILVVAPLLQLTAAVTHWRRAGGYDPRNSRVMPAELRELSRAFKQATRSLALHEQELREAEAKQELLIKEIHHRVKNNLQIIASLLNLQANRIRQPEARAEFASARDRVRALATLHRYLYSEGDLQTLNMRSFLQELCTQLFQAIGEKQGHRIQLHIEAPEIAMATDQAVPLSLVVTEAVSNAVKYAFPSGRRGSVRVILSELGGGMGRLVIEDDGIGIPAGRAETETGIRDGLGIQLIRGFARQLGARLDVREGGGTRYMLTFPLHPKGEESAADEEDADEGAEAGHPVES